MKIKVSSKAIDKIEADVLVLPFFHDEKPLKEHSGLADWRMNGAISRLILSGTIDGTKGESTLLLPNRRFSSGKILLVGLGNSSDIREEDIKGVALSIMEHLRGVGTKRFAIAIPLGESSALDAPQTSAALLKGLKEADTSKENISGTIIVNDESLKVVKKKIDGLKKDL